MIKLMEFWTVGILVGTTLLNLFLGAVLAQQQQGQSTNSNSHSINNIGPAAELINNYSPNTVDELHPSPQNLRLSWLAKFTHYPLVGNEIGLAGGNEDDENNISPATGSAFRTTSGFSRSLRRLGSEFLGKRMLANDPNPFIFFQTSAKNSLSKRGFEDGSWGKKRRLGSEFLGKRNSDNKGVGYSGEGEEDGEDEELRGEDGEESYNSNNVNNIEQVKRALGSEFLGKRNLYNGGEPGSKGTLRGVSGLDWARLVSPHWDRAHFLHTQLMQQKRRLIGSEFLGK